MQQKTEFVAQDPERTPILRKKPGFFSHVSSLIMMAAGLLAMLIGISPMLSGDVSGSWVSTGYVRANLFGIGLMLLLHGFYAFRRNHVLTACSPEDFAGKLKNLQVLAWLLPLAVLMVCNFSFLVQGYSTPVGQGQVGYVAASYIILTAVLLEAMIHVVPWDAQRYRKLFTILVLVYQAVLTAVLLFKGVLLPDGRGVGRFFVHFPLVGSIVITIALWAVSSSSQFSSVAYRRQVGPYFFMNGRPRLVDEELLEVPKANKHGCRKHMNWVLPVMAVVSITMIFLSTSLLCENAENGFGMDRFLNFLMASVVVALLFSPYVKFKLTEYTFLNLADHLAAMFWILILINVMATHPNFSWKTYCLMFFFWALVALEIECPCALLRSVFSLFVDTATVWDMDDYQYEQYQDLVKQQDAEMRQLDKEIEQKKQDDDYNRRYHAPRKD